MPNEADETTAAWNEHMASDDENRALGPEMLSEGWMVVGGDDIMWLHPPSRRCLVVNGPCTRENCRAPCWGLEPKDRGAMGYFVACRVHNDGGEPLYGDAFWVESYGRALRLARRIRSDILREPPSEAARNRSEFKHRQGEAWGELRNLAARNAHLVAKPHDEGKDGNS